jgi:hypothetical protein
VKTKAAAKGTKEVAVHLAKTTRRADSDDEDEDDEYDGGDMYACMMLAGGSEPTEGEETRITACGSFVQEAHDSPVVLLDCCANRSVFGNPALLSNIRKPEKVFRVRTAQGVVRVDRVGDLKGWDFLCSISWDVRTSFRSTSASSVLT